MDLWRTSYSEYFCRYSEITRSKFHNDNPNVCGPQRNPGSYNSAVGNPQVGGCRRKGIKVKSVFNALKHFHVRQPGVPPCIWGYFILQSWSVLEVFHWFKKSTPRSSSTIWCSHKTTWCQPIGDQAFRLSYLKLEFPIVTASIDWWQKWKVQVINPDDDVQLLTLQLTYGLFGLHFGFLQHYSGTNLKFRSCIMHFEIKPCDFTI